MNRTLGELVDRLSILNVKLFMVQEQVFECSRRYVPLPADQTRKLADLNLERTRTMSALDEALKRAIETGEVDVDTRTKLTGD